MADSKEYTLIITEKPSSALKLANALADGKVEKRAEGRVPYYTITRKNEPLVVVPAVGHLYGLSSKDSGYPVFNVEWSPSHEVGKGSEFTKPYLDSIIKLAKKAKAFVAATDFDIEGEVIAANILDYACKAKEAKRMKFSTLTKEDLEEAFERPLPSLNAGMVKAGRTRHQLDFYWGVSLSRALMHAIKSAGMFKVLSVGRVQGPALAILAKREKEIGVFVPKPFWVLLAKEGETQFEHEHGPYFDQPEAKAAFSNTSKDGVVEKVEKSEFKQNPPTPFDLTTLQTESHRCFGNSPARTLEIAQRLYEQAFISYPRTASQKLPPQLNLSKIISKLGQQPAYAKFASELIAHKRFTPNEGKNTDPAHPAIYPTGESPSKLGPQEMQLYDLIARRFLATFATPAVKEKVAVKAKFGREPYGAAGIRTVERNWLEYYGPFAKTQEEVLPSYVEGQKLHASELKMDERQTRPPERFTEASLVKKLEDEELGTKATRSAVIQTLFDRGYVKGKSIEVTPFGMAIYTALDANSPQVLSETLTREIESDMERITDGERKDTEVVEKGKATLSKLIDEFKTKETAIGKQLLSAFNTTQREQSVLGKCVQCEAGNLLIRRSKFGQFVGCSSYPNCRATYPLPGGALIKAANKACEKCRTPIIWVKRKGKKPWSMCLLPTCETKKSWAKPMEQKLAGEAANVSQTSAKPSQSTTKPASTETQAIQPNASLLSAVKAAKAKAVAEKITAAKTRTPKASRKTKD